MNKTVSISLAGFSFIIEEHAYIKLNDYLNALRSSLEKEEADEVMYDIEVRITEIFRASLGKREVVSTEDVEKVIAQIGTPEVIEEQEEAYYSEANNQTHQKQEFKKQLFRDPQNRKIAGVCSGLAHYIGIDVAIMRVIWVLSLLFGLFPAALFYILFWVVMPEAETASDFLKMKGKPIDFDHLKEESVRFANESSKKMGEFYTENKPTIVEAGSRIWKVMRSILGILFIMLAIKLVVGMIFAALGISGMIGLGDFREIDFYFENAEMKYVLSAMVVSILLGLAVLFLGIGVKFFSPKLKFRGFGLVSGLCFAIFGGLLVYFATQMAWQDDIYTGTNHEEENVAIAHAGNVLELDIKKVEIPQNFKAYGNDIFSDKKRVFERERPDVYITRRNDVGEPYLIIKKKAKGYNVPIRMTAPVEMKNGRVLFPNYIGYSYDHRLRDYGVTYELVVPRDMRIEDLSKGRLDIERDDYHDYDDILDNDYDDLPIRKGENIRIETPSDTVVIKRQ